MQDLTKTVKVTPRQEQAAGAGRICHISQDLGGLAVWLAGSRLVVILPGRGVVRLETDHVGACKPRHCER